MPNNAFDKVKAARANNRPTGKDYIDNIFADFIELHGDRCFADDPAIVGGVAYLGQKPVTVITIEKGHAAQGAHEPKLRRAQSRRLQKSAAAHEAG